MYNVVRDYREMIYVALSWVLTLANSLVAEISVQWENEIP